MRPDLPIRTGTSAELTSIGVPSHAKERVSDTIEVRSGRKCKPAGSENALNELRPSLRPLSDTNNCDQTSPRAKSTQPFFSISELAERWRFSRASVYNILRGEKVVDFAANGKKGHKLVPLDVVLKIEREHLRVLR